MGRSISRSFFSVLVCLGISAAANAQLLKDNSRISAEAKKKAGDRYELMVHMQLEKGWHVYAMKPGGDGLLFAPAVSFKKDPRIKLVGGVKEKGKMISEVMIEGDPKVNMYSDKVDYIQQATIDGATVISGTYEYQICNDKGTCLSPTKKEFKIVVKS